ncbi:hypothetical protein RRG08_041800 [Elysia crispata]|uniref:Uncharacterized protein n=1 Tax=Elysia crispata TaxID=231223 RepID=A0AAE0YTI8_9GAST|nr:hypothetical protein RRG08_041800 [Elysia crispata]
MIVKFLHLFKHWTFSINRDLKEYFRPVIFGLQKQYSEMRVAVRVAIVQHSCQIKGPENTSQLTAMCYLDHLRYCVRKDLVNVPLYLPKPIPDVLAIHFTVQRVLM